MSELIIGVTGLARRMNRSKNYVYSLVRKGLPHGTATGKLAFDYDAVTAWCLSSKEDEAEIEARRIANEIMGGM